jgi:hypothetical protein
MDFEIETVHSKFEEFPHKSNIGQQIRKITKPENMAQDSADLSGSTIYTVKWTFSASIFRTVHYQFSGHQYENLKMIS